MGTTPANDSWLSVRPSRIARTRAILSAISGRMSFPSPFNKLEEPTPFRRASARTRGRGHRATPQMSCSGSVMTPLDAVNELPPDTALVMITGRREILVLMEAADAGTTCPIQSIDPCVVAERPHDLSCFVVGPVAIRAGHAWGFFAARAMRQRLRAASRPIFDRASGVSARARALPPSDPSCCAARFFRGASMPSSLACLALGLPDARHRLDYDG